jgi:hypothetical protein
VRPWGLLRASAGASAVDMSSEASAGLLEGRMKSDLTLRRGRLAAWLPCAVGPSICSSWRLPRGLETGIIPVVTSGH